MSVRSSDSVDGLPVYLRSFLGQALVECPRCKLCASVTAPSAKRKPRVICGSCSYFREGYAAPEAAVIDLAKKSRCGRCNEWLGDARTHYRASEDQLDVICPCGAIRTMQLASRWVSGAPIDPYFRIPLWLQTAVGGENLWAYNAEHLAFLRSYLSGALRERVPNENRSLVSRLPLWMKSAKRRDAVLKGLARLQDRVDRDGSR